MLRIGICDDSAEARFVLRAALERILENRKIQGQIYEFSAGENLLRWFDHHMGELELIFLDMELHQLDGLETARRLRAMDAGLQLVFVTGYPEHVFEGYSVGALGYLLKPPKQEQLEDVLERARQRCTVIWSGPIFAITEIPTTGFPFPVSSTLHRTGARYGALRKDVLTASTVNWTPWHRR